MKRIAFVYILVFFGMSSLLLAAPRELVSHPDWWIGQMLPEDTKSLELPAWMTPVEKAKAEALAGRYRKALYDLHVIPNPDPVQAAIVRGMAWAGLAKRDRALTALSEGTVANDPGVQLLTARILIDDGQYTRAIDILKQHIEKNPTSITGHYLLGEVLEAAGDMENALVTYKWFIDKPQDFMTLWNAQGATKFENAEEVTNIARAVDRWATLTGAYKTDQDLHNTLLRMFTQAYDVIDRNYWPAHVAAAEFYMNRSDEQKALKQAVAASAANPNDPHLLTVLAEIAQASGQLPAVAQAMERLRAADADSFDADVIEIISQVGMQAIPQAADRAADLIKKRPDDLRALGIAAAMAQISADEDKYKAYLKHADEIAPKSPIAYAIAGQLLAEVHQQVVAEQVLEEAVKRAPWMTVLAHGLGELYVNNGREDDARLILTKASETDPFNPKTVNYLRLLDELAKFNRYESTHFVFYFDQRTDPLVIDFMVPYMEQAFTEVTTFFQYTPQQKVAIQVYPTMDEFSVRMAGIPGIENYGVSFGHVLAVIAPRKGETNGNFHWARVMKHEFTHTINLLATGQRVPRWLTEGLAVMQEGLWFRFPDVPRELATRAAKDELFTVRGLAAAFIRPHKPSDGEQAYTQGSWLARYIDITYGHPALLKLIDGYGHGKSDEDAFHDATGKPLPEIEKAYHAWVKEKVKDWGYPTDEKEAKKYEEDLKKLAKDGDELIRAKKFKEAFDSWNKYYTMRPQEKIPNQRMAYLYMQKDLYDAPKALSHLEFLHWLELSNNLWARQMSRLYLKENNPDKALYWAWQAVFIDLYDPKAHELLADVADKAGQPEIAEKSREAIKTIADWNENFDKNSNKRAEERAKANHPEATTP